MNIETEELYLVDCQMRILVNGYWENDDFLDIYEDTKASSVLTTWL